MKNAEKIEKLIKKYFDADKAAVRTDESHDQHTIDSAVSAFNRSNKTARQSDSVSLWRIIMQNKKVQFAAAAVIIIAVMSAIYFSGGSLDGSSIAWADVIEPILIAKTASMDIVIGSDDKQVVIHDEIMGSLIRRTVPQAAHASTIIDLENMKIMVIDPDKKTVVYVDIKGLDEVKNYLDMLKTVVNRLQDNPHLEVENQGIRDVDGSEYVVFVAKVADETITVYVDPESVMPVSIVHETPNMKIAARNIRFDVELDKSLFSQEVPNGYKVQESGIDFKENSEASFIESLRIMAEYIGDGQFPDSIALEDIVKIAPKFQEGLDKAQLSEEEQMDIGVKFGQGLVFIRYFKGQGQWHYAGKGVKLGDAESPIFWYQPQNSETFRVIYGDLSVKNVSPDQLPE